MDVIEPMGMETFVYFYPRGSANLRQGQSQRRCRAGGPLRLAVDLNNMHLLNEVTGAVI